MTAATLSDDVLDGALNIIKNNGTKLFICTTQPTSYAEASSTYALGNKASPSYTGPADDASGRKLTVSAITDGTVTSNGTAAFFALTNGSNALYATQALNATQAVSSGNTFTLTAIVVNIPDPTA